MTKLTCKQLREKYKQARKRSAKLRQQGKNPAIERYKEIFNETS